MQSMCIRQVKEHVINKTHRTLINMKVELVKVRTISNKAFLLLVVDAINAIKNDWKIKNREGGTSELNTEYVNIVSETNVEAYYLITGPNISIKYFISYTFDYDSVAIRIYLLNLINGNGQSIPRHALDNPNLKKFLDELLQKTVAEHKDKLLSMAEKIQNYDNLSCQLTSDSIYDGTLFDTLPDLNIQLQICDKPQNKVDNPDIHHHSNEEKQSLGFMLGRLSVVIEDNWKVILGIIGVIFFIIIIIAGICA